MSREQFSRVLRLLENGVSFSALTVLLISVLWGVLTRYITASPAVWATELSGILFTWVVYVGAMTAFRDGRHIRITLLLDALPRPARKVLEFVADLIMVIFLFYVTYLSIEMMALGATRPSPVLRIPFSWVYLATVIAFGVMSITALLRLLGVIEVRDDDAALKDVI